MKSYEILYKTNDFYLVVIKSLYNVGQIIKKFEFENIENSNFFGEVVFDLLLSSISWNSEDRFWNFKIINGKIDYNSKKNYKLDLNYKNMANIFFENNNNLLKGSLLSNKSKNN